MLNRLLAGDTAGSSDELARLLIELRSRLVAFEVAAARLRQGRRDVSVYGPYIGRAYLETAATVLIARLDPFRVLAAKRHQSADYYEPEQRSKSGIQWSGDVVAPEKPGAALWSVTTREVGCRSLLGAWNEDLVWMPAFDALSDAIAREGPLHDWIIDLSKRSVNGFCKEMRSALERLFSKYSKGVHNELLGQRDVIFDAVSVEADYRTTAETLTCFALLSHFSEHFRYRMGPQAAMRLADRIGRNWK